MFNVAYVLDLFPVFSETFIVREMLELRRKGLNFLVFAKKNTAGTKFSEVIHNDAEKIIKDVYYYSSIRENTSKLQQALYHLYFLLLNPIKYLKTFMFSYRCGRKTFMTFRGSVLFAMKMKRAGVRHIHAHFALDACTNAMIISMYTGIPYSFTAHAHDIFIPKLSEFIEEKFNRAKMAVCISDYNKNYVLNRYQSINEKQIQVIHCGINIEKFTPRIKKGNDKFEITAIGRLVEHKGFKYLIQACKLLEDQTKLNFICNIIGEGGDRLKLEKLVRKCDVGKSVRFLGAMEQIDVMMRMKNTDVFVLPCVIEQTGMRDGIPVAIMEAMAMAIPVVSTTVSGIPELVKNGAGILVEPQDVNHLAKAIETILSMRDEQRKEMGRRGRAIVEDLFNIEKEVQKLAGFFGT